MSKRLAFIAAVPLALGIFAGVALAGVASAIVRTDTNQVRLTITKENIAENLYSGYHTHPGPVILQVTSGQIKIYQGSCAPKVIATGETYIEVPRVPGSGRREGACRVDNHANPTGRDGRQNRPYPTLPV